MMIFRKNLFLSCVLLVWTGGLDHACTYADHLVTDMILTDEQYEVIRVELSPEDRVDGDKIITDEQLQELSLFQLDVAEETNTSSEEVDEDSQERDKRNAIRNTDYHWPDGVIPWRADRSFRGRHKKMLKNAMKIWSKYTCLSFRKAKRRRDRNYVLFRNGNMCASYVGMIGGRQYVWLAKFGCRDQATFLHEIGHAIGLYHAHNRPDRDDYIDIDLSNVHEVHHTNFVKRTSDEVDTHDVNYDHHSIMHYGGNDFGLSDEPVIETKDENFQDIIGNYRTLSFGDIEMVFKMYNCKPSDCNLNETDCPEESFVGKDCECVCPGPNDLQLVQHCDQINQTAQETQRRDTLSRDEATQVHDGQVLNVPSIISGDDEPSAKAKESSQTTEEVDGNSEQTTSPSDATSKATQEGTTTNTAE